MGAHPSHICTTSTNEQKQALGYKLFGNYITVWQRQCCSQVCTYKLKFVSKNKNSINILKEKLNDEKQQKLEESLNEQQHTILKADIPKQLGSKFMTQVQIPSNLKQLEYKKYYIKKSICSIIKTLQQDSVYKQQSKSNLYSIQIYYDMFYDERYRKLLLDAIIRSSYELYLRKKAKPEQTVVLLRFFIPQLNGFQEIQSIKIQIEKEFKFYDMLRQREKSLDMSSKLKS